MATLTINGKEITVEDNTLILDAAREAGFEVPTFCYQADLSRLGSCRVCIIEIEGQRKLQPACVTPVMQDMVVFTESPVVKEARSGVLEFFLSNHAMDCPVCDKAGECELQDLVYKHGPHEGVHSEVKRRFHDEDYVLSPVIVKNSNRCVQCLRCVRVCREAVGTGVLGAIGRGAGQEETSFLKTYLDCDQCGNCIEVCPVGCFMRRPYRYKARPWDLTSAASICPYCATGCRVNIQERDGEVVRSLSKFGKGVNSELLCARGRFGYDYVNNPERLTTPLVKKDGKLQEATWEEALTAVKEGLRKSGSSRIAGIASARLTNEELYLFQKLFRGVLGSHNIDSSSRWSASGIEAFVAATGMDHGGVSLLDCLESNSILLIGAQLSDENPVTDYRLRLALDNRRINLMIASPRGMKLDSSAQISLRHNPAAEGDLLKALSAYIFAHSRASFTASGALGEELEAYLEGLFVDELAKSAGFEVDDLHAIATNLSSVEKVSIIAGTEFLRYPESNHGLSILAKVLRALGKELKILPVLDRNNQRGAWDMGVHPFFGPGYERVEVEGLDTDEILEAADDRQIDALYVAGEDILNLYPDQRRAVEVLSKLKFLVVQDIFLTEAAEMADVVLPGATYAEKEGSYTNQEGRVQHIEPLLPPPGDAKRDLDIFVEIGKTFNGEFGPVHPDCVLKEIRESNPMYKDVVLVAGTHDSALINERPGQVEARLFGQEPKKPVDGEKPSDKYPFTLVTGNHLFFSGQISRRSTILSSLLKEPIVEISEGAARDIGVKSGERVKVKGAHHEVTLEVRINKGSKDSIAFVPENFAHIVPVNRFFKRGEGIQKVDIRPLSRIGGGLKRVK